MSAYKQIFIYGFAIFAMFFGSGNLVFPLQIGQASGSQWLGGFLGLFLTGILLPFLGLLVIKLHRGSYRKFFAEGGKIAEFILPLFTLSLLGSFGVIPRCITVAHGGIEQLAPQMPLMAFSLAFCILTYIFCLRDHLMIQILGKWMTPILLISLIILILLGSFYASPLENEQSTLIASFTTGFQTGYQTMDLFAAFFFSALIFRQIQEMNPQEKNHKAILKMALKPSIVGAGLLAIIYLGFVYLGAHYQSITQGIAPELILPTIALHILGEQATFLIAVIVIFSCLTTAIALNNIYARYLCDLLKIKNCFFPLVLGSTIGTSFLISLMDFQGIASFLSPALKISYPGLILLTIMSIFSKGHPRLKKAAFYGVILLTVLYWYFN